MNSVKPLETVLGSDNIAIDVQQLSTDDFVNVAFLALNPARLRPKTWWLGWWLPGSINLPDPLMLNWLISQDFGLDAKKTKSSLAWGSILIHNSLKEADAENKDVAKLLWKIRWSSSLMIDTL